MTQMLQPELDAFRQGWEARVGDGPARTIAGDIETLRASGILGGVAKPGQAVADPGTLIDARGHPADLGALLADRPAILTFYRGGWCPYCNLDLRAYQALLPEIEAAGARLIAVSPELPDAALDTAETNALAFPVLSDVGGKLAASLGLRFTLTETLRPFYEGAGHALPKRNGDGS